MLSKYIYFYTTLTVSLAVCYYFQFYSAKTEAQRPPLATQLYLAQAEVTLTPEPEHVKK